MKKIDMYLAELIRARLENREPVGIPEDDESIAEIYQAAKINQIMNLVLVPLLDVVNSDAIKNEIKKKTVACVTKSMLQMNLLNNLATKFEEAGVVNQILKGSVLKNIYPSHDMREMGDIDILIKEECMDKAKEILEGMGLIYKGKEEHHDIYTNLEKNLMVEVHHVIYNEKVDKNQSEYFAAFERTNLKEGCKYTYQFNLEDFYIYMIAHAAKHFYEKGCGIRNLVDIYVYRNIYDSQMDKKYLNEQLEKCGLISFTKHMEIMSDIWLNNEKTTEFYDNLFTYMKDGGLYGKDENGVWNKFTGEGANSKNMKLWYCLPPFNYMREYYPWIDKCKLLLPVAWIVRIVRGIIFNRGKERRNLIKNTNDEQIDVVSTIYRNMEFNFRR